MVVIFWVLAGISLIAIIQWLGILLLVRKFIVMGTTDESKSEAVSDEQSRATLSVVVPIKGADESSKAALTKLVRLPMEEADSEILFVMEEDTDPAYAMVTSIMEDHPAEAERCRIILSGKCEDGMGKLHNMREGIRQAAHDQLLFMDADVEMTEVVISHGLKQIADSRVGSVSAIPLYRNPVAWGESVIAIWTNDYYLPYLLGLRQVKSFPFMIGACSFIRRDVLNVLDNLEGTEQYMSDDAIIAEKIDKAGFETRVLPYTVTMTESKRFSEGWRHLLRWFVMLKSFNPLVYMSIHNWHGIYISLLTTIAALFTGIPALIISGICLLFVASAVKILGSIWFNNRLKGKEPIGKYLKIVVYECLVFPGVWVIGLFKKTLHWRGRKYTVGLKGTINKVETDAKS